MLPVFNGAADEGSGPKPELRRGAQGAHVRTLQRRLNRLLNLKLDVDGRFGPMVERFVKQFQTSRGLAASGVVDAATWTALGFPPQGGVVAPAASKEEPQGAWASIVNRWSQEWHRARDAAVAQWDKMFAKDPEKARPKVEKFIQDLNAAKANLDAMKPLVPAHPKTAAERKIVQNFDKMTARYNTLASGLYSEAVRADGPKVGFPPALIALGWAISAVGAAWAYTGNTYATELREETALYKADLDARVAASKEGRTLQPSTIPGRPSEQKKKKSGGGMVLVGGVLAAAAAAAAAYALFGGKRREATA